MRTDRDRQRQPGIGVRIEARLFKAKAGLCQILTTDHRPTHKTLDPISFICKVK